MQYNQNHQALLCLKPGNLLCVLDAVVSLTLLLNDQGVYCTDIKLRSQRILAGKVFLPDNIH